MVLQCLLELLAPARKKLELGADCVLGLAPPKLANLAAPLEELEELERLENRAMDESASNIIDERARVITQAL